MNFDFIVVYTSLANLFSVTAHQRTTKKIFRAHPVEIKEVFKQTDCSARVKKEYFFTNLKVN